jgi:hypothetical protein
MNNKYAPTRAVFEYNSLCCLPQPEAIPSHPSYTILVNAEISGGIVP